VPGVASGNSQILKKVFEFKKKIEFWNENLFHYAYVTPEFPKKFSQFGPANIANIYTNIYINMSEENLYLDMYFICCFNLTPIL